MTWLAAAFAVFFCCIVLLADVGHLPASVQALYAFPGGDKVGHFLLMGSLSFFVNGGIAERLTKRGLPGNILATALVALFVTVEELSQIIFASRTFSLEDLAASYLGILSLGFLARRIGRKDKNVGPAPRS